MSTKTSNGMSIFLAILPILMPYRIPGTGLRLPTILTAIAFFYCILQLPKRKLNISVGILIPFFLYLVYVMTKSTIQMAFFNGSVIIIISTICTGIINVQRLRNIIEMIAALAAICVILQQFVHIIVGIHIPLILGSFMAEDLLVPYGFLLTTGIGIEGIYRPSAFFLEPAHFSQYCIIGLGSCLFTQFPNFKRAILISFGVLACTSGMGFVSVFAMWLWWLLTRNSSKKEILRKVPFLILGAFIAFFILDNISFTHGIISRFMPNSDSDYNAINGRLFWWDTFFGDFSVSGFLWGFGWNNLPEDVYFTGFMKILFCYGVVGVFLFFIFLIILILKSDYLGMACVALYSGLLFFADLTYYHNLLFYIGTFLVFYLEKKNQVYESKIIDERKIKYECI